RPAISARRSAGTRWWSGTVWAQARRNTTSGDPVRRCSRVGDRRCRRLPFGLDSRLQEGECGGRIVRELEEGKVAAVDHAVTDERLEVDDLAPIARSVEDDRDGTLDLTRLHQREDLEHFV